MPSPTEVADSLAMVVHEDDQGSIVLSGGGLEGVVSYMVTVGPDHGSVTVDGNVAVYIPFADYNGPDAFQYVAANGEAVSGAGVVTVTVLPVNDAPVLVVGQTAMVEENQGPVARAGWVEMIPGPANEAHQFALSYTVSNVSDPTMFAQGPAVDSLGTLSFETAWDRFGTATFDLVGRDSGGTERGGVDVSTTATLAITVGALPRWRTYTTTEDFLEGELLDVVYDVPDQLRTRSQRAAFGYVWVAVSNRGTIVRLDAETGAVLGEYHSAPDAYPKNPSRTTVDELGNAWAGNRAGNSVVHILVPESNLWVDRNGNGVLDTSTGLGDIRPWTGDGVDGAEDELIAHFVEVRSEGVRHVSAATDRTVWVGGTIGQFWDQIDIVSGEIIRQEPSVEAGGYGGLVTRAGVLWSTKPLMRWDTRFPLGGPSGIVWQKYGDASYGTTEDPFGNVWISQYNKYLRRFSPTGEGSPLYRHGGMRGQGLAADQRGHIWVAHSQSSSQTVGHLLNDGTWIGNVRVGNGPTGVSVDVKGRIWVTNLRDGTVSRINPDAGPFGADGVTPVGEVDLTTQYLGGTLYNYSDMTGSSRSAFGQDAYWSVVYDSTIPGANWGRVGWNADVCNDGGITVLAGASDDPNEFPGHEIVDLLGAPISTTGRYIQVMVQLRPASDGTSPVLYDLTVGTMGYPEQQMDPYWGVFAGGDMEANWPGEASLVGAICNNGLFPMNDVPVTWSKVDGPGGVDFKTPHESATVVSFGSTGVYTLRLTSNRDGDVRTDDLICTVVPMNRPPWVSIGGDRILPNAAQSYHFYAQVRDEGLPEGSTLSQQWTKQWGPGDVTFGDATAAATDISFSQPGIYRIRLTANDTELEYHDEVEVRVGLLCTVVNTPGMSAWWPANGTEAEVVRGNTAMLRNGMGHTNAGAVGQAFRFDGVDDYAHIINHDSMDLGAMEQGFTVEFWINPGSARAATVMEWRVPGAAQPAFELLQEGSSGLRFVMRDAQGQVVAEVPYSGVWTTSSWRHFALTFDASTRELLAFSDGTLWRPHNSVAWTYTVPEFERQTGPELYFGAAAGTGGFFHGSLDEITLYEGALGSATIYNIFNAGAVGKCPTGENEPPLVEAGPDLVVPTGVPLLVEGSVTDDGLPPDGELSMLWSDVGGPDAVSFFDTATSHTVATFPAAGLYRLRLNADDGSVQTGDRAGVWVGSGCQFASDWGMVAWWTGEDDAGDVVGSNHGHRTNGAGITAGQVGRAYSFDGAGDYIRIRGTPETNVAANEGSFTVEFWMRPTQARDADVFEWKTTAGGQGTAIRQRNNGAINVILNPSAATIGVGAGLAANSWSHIGVVWDAPDRRLSIYVDGVSLYSGVQPIGGEPDTSGNILLGGEPGNYRGHLDEVTLYSRALSPDAVHAVSFFGGPSGKCPPDGNLPPVVSAGPDRVGMKNAWVQLDGEVTDDGLPEQGMLQVEWTKVRGPGEVTFADATAPATAAAFTAPGVYTLRLTADDGLVKKFAQMTARVEAPCALGSPADAAAWWTGDAHFFDSAGESHGYRGNGVSFAEGHVSQAFSFNGTNHFVNIPATAATDLGAAGDGSFTVEFWMRPTSSRVADLIEWKAQDGAQGFQIQQYTSGVRVLHEGAIVASATSAWTLNTYTHVAVTWEAADRRLTVYTHGFPGASTVLPGTWQPVTVGDVLLGESPYYLGQLDEVALFHRALRADEVQAIVAAGTFGKCAPGENRWPQVSAGPDRVATVGQPLLLQGSVTDDGLPAEGQLRTQWTMERGPAPVAFTDPAAPATTVPFPAPGVYLLRLTADDGLASAFDQLLVRVDAPCSAALPTDAVAWWPGDHDFPDVIGESHGHRVGATSFAAGKVAGAFSFASSNTSVRVPATPQIDVAGDGSGFTIEFWMYPTSSRNADIIEWKTPAGDQGFMIQQVASGSAIRVTNGSTILTTIGDAWATGTSDDWRHIAVTWEASERRLEVYTSGVQRYSVIQSGTWQPITSGDLWFSESSFYQGRLDEIALYRRALRADEILSIKAADSNGKCPPDNNHRPVVSAGPDRNGSPAAIIELRGSASDDGLPFDGTFVTNWTVLNSPTGATVSIADPASPSTTATFSHAGLYLLQLRADDGAKAATDNTLVRIGQTCLEPATPPVAWWPANGDYRDAIGGNHAYPISGTGFAAGKVSQAFSFDGTANSIRVPATTETDVAANGAAFTVEFWMRPTQSRNADVVEWMTATGNQGFLIQQRSSGTAIRVSNGATILASITTGWTLNQWTHIAVTWTGEPTRQLLVHVNGSQRYAQPQTGTWQPDTSGDFLLSESNFFRGQLDEIALHGMALSQPEIAAIVASGIAGRCLPPSPNLAPIVNAGEDQVVTLPNHATLRGTVIDDGYPEDAPLSSLWTTLLAPAPALIANPANPYTTATLTTPGVYTFLLTANDTDLTTTDTVNITVLPKPNEPPTITSTANALALTNGPHALSATATDDGLPEDSTLVYTWSQVAGPAAATIANPNQSVTAATFPATGVYTLRTTVTDGEYTAATNLTIRVTRAPAVVITSPGSPTTVALGARPTITAQANDDRAVTSVAFHRNGQLEAPYTAAPWSHLAPGLTTGLHRYTAIATDDDGLATTGNEVLIWAGPLPPGPTVEIQTPTDSAQITAPTPIIGTATSAILASYRVEYRYRQTPPTTWQQLHTATTPITAGQLALFDTTLLRNGIYEIRLSATDTLGRTATTPPRPLLVWGYLKMGEFTYTSPDITIRAPGIPVTVERFYDSRNKQPGEFGTGTDTTLGAIRLQKTRPLGRDWYQYSVLQGFFPVNHIAPHPPITATEVEQPRLVTITFADDKVYAFKARMSPNQSSILPIQAGRVKFDPLPGTAGAKLEPLHPSTSQLDEQVFVYGSVGFVDLLNSEASDFYDPQRFRLQLIDGSSYIVDQTLGLLSLTDANGNTVTRQADGLYHTSGQKVIFEKDSLGRITSVTDANGQKLYYEYNVAGQLITTIDRVGNQVFYDYFAGTTLVKDIRDSTQINPTHNAYDGFERFNQIVDSLGHATKFRHDRLSYVTETEDALGRVTKQTRDTKGNVVAIEDPYGHITRFEFADAHHPHLPTKKTDALGGITSYLYDASGNLTKETDARGNPTTYTYNSAGKPTTITDARGALVRLEYDAFGNNTRHISPLGHNTTYTYNARGQMLTETSPIHTSQTSEYDQNGYKTALRHYDSDGDFFTETLWQYDANGNTTNSWARAQNSDGTFTYVETVWAYDANDRVVSMIPPGGPETVTQYNSNGKVAKIIRAGRNVVENNYNDKGQLVAKLYPDGSFESYEYDPVGNKVQSVDRRGYLITYEYDLLNRNVRENLPENTAIIRTFDALGRNLAETDQYGNTSVLDYDPVGNAITRGFPDGTSESLVYDAVNNLIQRHPRTTANGSGQNLATERNQANAKLGLGEGLPGSNEGIRYVYDDGRRLITTEYADGTRESIEYDELNRVIMTTNRVGYWRKYSYATPNEKFRGPTHHLRSLIEDEYGTIEETAYSEDEFARKTSVTDGKDYVTKYKYDPGTGNLERIEFPDDTTIENTYEDKVLTESTSRRGYVTLFGYDSNADHKNPTSMTIKDYTPTLAVTMTYDAVGNMTSRTQGMRTQSFTYDYWNRRISETDGEGEVYKNVWDGSRRIYTDGRGNDTVYTLDANRFTTHVQFPPDGGTISYEVDWRGRITKEIDPRGHKTEYAYNMPIVTRTNPLEKTAQFEYDAVENLLSFKDENGHTTRYEYDGRRRLTKITHPDDTTEEFQYDGNNNLVEHKDQLQRITTYVYDKNNRLETVTHPDTAVEKFVYDADGNLTSHTNGENETTTQEFDPWSRRISVTDPEDNTTRFTVSVEGDIAKINDVLGRDWNYVYDSRGRRESETDYSGATTLWTYDGNNNVVTIKDPRTHETKYAYDAMNREFQIDYPDGGTLKKEYFSNGLLKAIEVKDLDEEGDEIWCRTSYEYTTTNWLEFETPPEGAGRQYKHDDVGNVTKAIVGEEHGDNQTTDYVYDKMDRVISIVDPAGRTTGITYTATGMRDIITMPPVASEAFPLRPPRTQDFDYDERDRVNNVRLPDGEIESYVYDKAGRMTDYIDPALLGTRYLYDKLGHLEEVARGAQVTKYKFDATGRLIEIVDPLLRTTSITFDDPHRTITTSLPRSATGAFPEDPILDVQILDPSRNLASRTKPDGSIISYEYDEMNRVSKIAAQGEVIDFVYNLRGLRTSMDDATGTSSYKYDCLGRRTEKASPRGTLHYGYDKYSNVTGIYSSNAEGALLNYGYDRSNLLTDVETLDAEFDPSRQYTIGRDGAGNVASFSIPIERSPLEPNRINTSHIYDPMSRATQTTTTYGYVLEPEIEIPMVDYFVPRSHPVGLPDRMIETPGRTVEYDYDQYYRLTRETINTPPLPDFNPDTVDYTIDLVGNRTSRSSTLPELPSVPGPIPYAPRDWPQGESRDLNGNPLNHSGNQFTFDWDDRLVRVMVNDSLTTHVINYAYDGDGALVAKTKIKPDPIEPGQFIEFFREEYHQDDLNPTGLTQILEVLDEQGRVKEVNAYGHRLISSTTIDYGTAAIHQNLSISASTHTAAHPPESALQLNDGTWLPGPNDQSPSITLQFHEARSISADRILLIEAPVPGAIWQISHNAEDWLDWDVELNPTAYTLYLRRQYPTPTAENPVHVQLFDYQIHNAASQVSEPDHSLDGEPATAWIGEQDDILLLELEDQVHNISGLVIKVHETNRALQIDTSVDGLVWEPIGTIAMNLTTQQVSFDDTLARFIRFANLSADPIAIAEIAPISPVASREYSIPTVRHPLFDGLGNIRHLINPAGDVTDTFTLDAYGNLLDRTGESDFAYGFQGERFDTDLQFYYLRARWYEPQTGRFLTPDKWAGSLMAPWNNNKFTYANANPVYYNDPTGYAPWTIFGIMFDAHLYFTHLSRVESGHSARPDATFNSGYSMAGQGTFNTYNERKRPGKVATGWIGGIDGVMVGGLQGYAVAIPAGDDHVLKGYSLNEINFHVNAGDEISKLERDVEHAFLAMDTVQPFAQSRDPYEPHGNHHYWLTGQWFNGFLTALRVMSDPQHPRMDQIRIDLEPQPIWRMGGISREAGVAASARAIRRMRPIMAATPESKVHLKIVHTGDNAWANPDAIYASASAEGLGQFTANVEVLRQVIGTMAIAVLGGATGTSALIKAMGAAALADSVATATEHAAEAIAYGLEGDDKAAQAAAAQAISSLPVAAEAAALGELSVAFETAGNCFVAGTPVLMWDSATTQVIEFIPIGERVATSFDDADTSARLEPTAETHRLVVARMPHSDGGEVMIETLMAVHQMAAEAVEVGGNVYLQLDELQLFGWAHVLAVLDCPPLRKGPGRLVISRLTTTLRGDLVEVRLGHADAEPITCTAGHPFWSATRSEWVLAGHLLPGEQLHTAEGSTLSVQSLRPIHGTATVHNIEVDGAHQYFAGHERVLVHNASRIPFGRLKEIAKAKPQVFERYKRVIRAQKAKAGGIPRAAPASSLSDYDFVQRIATRAELAGQRAGVGAAGTGPRQGTWKHGYAKKLLERYQSVTGQKMDLLAERSYKHGIQVYYGKQGSARPDVYNRLTGEVFDYKFVANPGTGLTARQLAKNAANLPFVTAQREVNP